MTKQYFFFKKEKCVQSELVHGFPKHWQCFRYLCTLNTYNTLYVACSTWSLNTFKDHVEHLPVFIFFIERILKKNHGQEGRLTL